MTLIEIPLSAQQSDPVRASPRAMAGQTGQVMPYNVAAKSIFRAKGGCYGIDHF